MLVFTSGTGIRSSYMRVCVCVCVCVCDIRIQCVYDHLCTLYKAMFIITAIAVFCEYIFAMTVMCS